MIPNEKFNVTNDPQLSLLREFGGNNYAHVILTAEADGLPTGDKELLEDHGLQMTCQFHARIDSSGYVRLLWESEDHRNGHAAIFEVKYRKKKATRAVTQSPVA